MCISPSRATVFANRTYFLLPLVTTLAMASEEFVMVELRFRVGYCFSADC